MREQDDANDRGSFEAGEQVMMLQLKHVHVVEIRRAFQTVLASQQQSLCLLLSALKRLVRQRFGRVDPRQPRLLHSHDHGEHFSIIKMFQLFKCALH